MDKCEIILSKCVIFKRIGNIYATLLYDKCDNCHEICHFLKRKGTEITKKKLCTGNIFPYQFTACTDKIQLPGKSVFMPGSSSSVFSLHSYGRRLSEEEVYLPCDSRCGSVETCRNVDRSFSGRPRDDPAWAGSPESSLCPKF